MSQEIDEIEALLPWYAAGALSQTERAQVEAALRRWPQLQASLATIEEDRGETVTLNEALGAPSPDVWARVLKGVEAAPRKPTLRARLASWLPSRADGRSPWLAGAGVAAALVIALQAAAIVGLLRNGAPKSGYATVTASTTSADALVAFSPEATMADVVALLKANHATIVGGPRASGIYELRFDGKAVARADIDAAVKRLAAAPIVRLALPGTGR